VNARAPAADLTLFLRVAPAVALRRRFAASSDREIFEVPAFQRRVARAYATALARMRRGGSPVDEVDGARPVDEVTAALGAAVAPRLR
jgi:dTMP kinase